MVQGEPMYCPNCGTENKEGSIYCNLCQEPLERYAAPSPHPGQAFEAGTEASGEAPLSGQPFQETPVPPFQGAPVQPFQGAPVQPWVGPGMPGPAYAPFPPPPGIPGPPPLYPGHPPYANYGSYPVVITRQSTPGEAVAALVLGIAGLALGCFGIPILCSILAIVFGIKARNMIDAGGGLLGGRGMATAGLVMGIIGMGLNTALFILIFAVEWHGGMSALILAAFRPLLPL